MWISATVCMCPQITPVHPLFLAWKTNCFSKDVMNLTASLTLFFKYLLSYLLDPNLLRNLSRDIAISYPTDPSIPSHFSLTTPS